MIKKRQSPSVVAQVKSQVRSRDGMRCTKCGMTADEHIAKTRKTLEVHRLIPGSDYTVEGCVTLCRSCHGHEPKRKNGQRMAEEPWVSRMTRIPEDMAEALSEVANRQYNTLSEQVKTACREYLERMGLMPAPLKRRRTQDAS